jgi:hypothetical protein
MVSNPGSAKEYGSFYNGVEQSLKIIGLTDESICLLVENSKRDGYLVVAIRGCTGHGKSCQEILSSVQVYKDDSLTRGVKGL